MAQRQNIENISPFSNNNNSAAGPSSAIDENEKRSEISKKIEDLRRKIKGRKEGIQALKMKRQWQMAQLGLFEEKFEALNLGELKAKSENLMAENEYLKEENLQIDSDSLIESANNVQVMVDFYEFLTEEDEDPLPFVSSQYCESENPTQNDPSASSTQDNNTAQSDSKK